MEQATVCPRAFPHPSDDWSGGRATVTWSVAPPAGVEKASVGAVYEHEGISVSSEHGSRGIAGVVVR